MQNALLIHCKTISQVIYILAMSGLLHALSHIVAIKYACALSMNWAINTHSFICRMARFYYGASS